MDTFSKNKWFKGIAPIIIIIVSFLYLTSMGSIFKSDTSISKDSYSNEIRGLPPATPIKMEVGQDYYAEQEEQFGELAMRFWSGEYENNIYSIDFLKEFDVDGDGVKEKIIGICSLWGNHCPHEILIIKNDKIIFSETAGMAYKDLIEADGNGFYVNWNDGTTGSGLAHPEYYISTRFIYKDNNFIPLKGTKKLFSDDLNTPYNTRFETMMKDLEDKETLTKEKYKCTEDANVWWTECIIEKLDQASAEREWKQLRFEGLKETEINTFNMLPFLAEEQDKIYKWRKGFETSRDNWCEAKVAFITGSGTPGAIADCKLDIEINAIDDLNKLYYKTLLFNIESTGITNFEPTQKDIDNLVKTNKTNRGCIWVGDKGCDD